MVYRVRFTHRAEKKYAALPQSARIRIIRSLEQYASDPFHYHDVKKVKGCPADKPRFRIRIGEYRATFRIIQDQLIVQSCRGWEKEEF